MGGKMNNRKLDIMVDLETLSTNNDATIFQIAAALFDVKTGDIIMSFDKRANIALNKDMVVSGSTLKWWVSQGKLLNELLNVQEDFSSDDLIKEFHLWVNNTITTHGKSNVRLIGNGPTFDIMILRTHFERLGLEYPIAFRNERCMRTILQLASDKLGIDHNGIRENCTPEGFTAHNAFWDVKRQIAMYSYCYNALMV